MKHPKKKALITRLRRVEGQLRGVQAMMEADAECEAVAQQLCAARRALDRAFYEMVACSVEGALDSAANADEARQAAGKVAALLGRYG